MQRLRQSPTDPAFVQDPYPFYEAARAAGDLFFWDDYGLPCAVSLDGVNRILKHPDMGREPPAPPDVPPHLAPFYRIEAHSMLELEPPRHTRLRALVLRAFTSRRIAAMEDEIVALCHALIDRFPDGSFDLIDAYARQVPVIVIARLLGVPEAMSEQLLAWSNAMVAMYQARRTREIEDRAAAASAEFADFVADHIAARRGHPADDLITQLIAAEEDGRKLSTDEMITTCILLLNAGHEATVHTLGNGVKALLSTPGAVAALAADPETAVEEILRHDPPLHMFTRWVYAETEISGHRLRPGDQVACLLGAANRDPGAWDAPARFDPARPVKTNVAFGAGRHFCIGAPLARLELRLALTTLFARCPDLALAAPPRYADLYHFHGLERLTVTR